MRSAGVSRGSVIIRSVSVWRKNEINYHHFVPHHSVGERKIRNMGIIALKLHRRTIADVCVCVPFNGVLISLTIETGARVHTLDVNRG